MLNMYKKYCDDTVFFKIETLEDLSQFAGKVVGFQAKVFYDNEYYMINNLMFGYIDENIKVIDGTQGYLVSQLLKKNYMPIVHAAFTADNLSRLDLRVAYLGPNEKKLIQNALTEEKARFASHSHKLMDIFILPLPTYEQMCSKEKACSILF